MSFSDGKGVKFSFIGTAKNGRINLSNFDKLKEEKDKDSLEETNDIAFSCNVDGSFTTSNDDISLPNSPLHIIQKNFPDFLDKEKDVITRCLFRDIYKFKVKDLLNLNVLTFTDTPICDSGISMLFLYKEYLLRKFNRNEKENPHGPAISLFYKLLEDMNLDKTENKSKKKDYEVALSKKEIKDFILNDNVFRKVNYEVVLFNFINDKAENLLQNTTSKEMNTEIDNDIIKTFLHYCFNNNFQEGKKLLYRIFKDGGDVIEHIEDSIKKIREALSLSIKVRVTNIMLIHRYSSN